MQDTKSIYNGLQKINSVLLILSLLWLTISLPVVYKAQVTGNQKIQAEGQNSLPKEDIGNQLAGNTEEKAPSGGINTLSEEYLHHSEETFLFFPVSLSHSTIHLISSYETFHGELLCPPPNC